MKTWAGQVSLWMIFAHCWAFAADGELSIQRATVMIRDGQIPEGTGFVFATEHANGTGKILVLTAGHICHDRPKDKLSVAFYPVSGDSSNLQTATFVDARISQICVKDGTSDYGLLEVDEQPAGLHALRGQFWRATSDLSAGDSVQYVRFASFSDQHLKYWYHPQRWSTLTSVPRRSGNSRTQTNEAPSDLYFLSAEASGGASGAPMVNADGDVVGMILAVDPTVTNNGPSSLAHSMEWLVQQIKKNRSFQKNYSRYTVMAERRSLSDAFRKRQIELAILLPYLWPASGESSRRAVPFPAVPQLRAGLKLTESGGWLGVVDYMRPSWKVIAGQQGVEKTMGSFSGGAQWQFLQGTQWRGRGPIALGAPYAGGGAGISEVAQTSGGLSVPKDTGAHWYWEAGTRWRPWKGPIGLSANFRRMRTFRELPQLRDFGRSQTIYSVGVSFFMR